VRPTGGRLARPVGAGDPGPAAGRDDDVQPADRQLRPVPLTQVLYLDHRVFPAIGNAGNPRHATHARNHPPGPASATRPQADQATYAARPTRRPACQTIQAASRLRGADGWAARDGPACIGTASRPTRPSAGPPAQPRSLLVCAAPGPASLRAHASTPAATGPASTLARHRVTHRDPLPRLRFFYHYRLLG